MSRSLLLSLLAFVFVLPAPLLARVSATFRSIDRLAAPSTDAPGEISIVVRTTADNGAGSLRQAIDEANQECGATGPKCRITFEITAAPSPDGWHTIRPLSPLPALGSGTIVDGSNGTGTNPSGPEIEIDGSLAGIASGFTIAGCDTVVSGLAINGFAEFGVLIRSSHDECPLVDAAVLRPIVANNFIGTDPTGTTAVPNGLRGVGVVNPNRPVEILGNVISGNTRSGIWLEGASSHLIQGNRIGVAAHSDAPLPNHASGIYVADRTSVVDIWENTIAHNGHWGVALHPRAYQVSIRRNAIHSNFALGIDYGLDFVTPNEPHSFTELIYGYGIPNHPLLTAARYEDASDTTVIEGILDEPIVDSPQVGYLIDFYSNAAPDRAGHGEGALHLGSLRIEGGAFSFTLEGDLTGRFVTATSTVIEQIGFAKPQPQSLRTGFWEKTSEFSNVIPVGP